MREPGHDEVAYIPFAVSAMEMTDSFTITQASTNEPEIGSHRWTDFLRGIPIFSEMPCSELSGRS